jgi:hypothetical protein
VEYGSRGLLKAAEWGNPLDTCYTGPLR